MATIGAIRDGIKTRLATISGLRVYDTVPDDVQVPAAVVIPVAVEYDATFDGGDDNYTFIVRVLASRVSERSGQDKLDGYLAPTGTGSIRAAIEAGAGLGGAADSSRVVRAENYGTTTVGNAAFLSVDLVVEVYG